jgi:hypothetical protein
VRTYLDGREVEGVTASPSAGSPSAADAATSTTDTVEAQQ